MKFSHSSDGGLDAFVDRLELVSEEAPRALVSAMATAAEEVLASEFATESDPSASPWAARVPPTGSWPILTKTGAMKASRSVTEEPSAIEISLASPANYHQSGTSRMVAREILPGGKVAPRWTDAMDKACGDKLRAMLEGQR